MFLKHYRKIGLQNGEGWINHLGIDGGQCRGEFVNSRVWAVWLELESMIVEMNGCFAFGIQRYKVEISI